MAQSAWYILYGASPCCGWEVCRLSNRPTNQSTTNQSTTIWRQKTILLLLLFLLCAPASLSILFFSFFRFLFPTIAPPLCFSTVLPPAPTPPSVLAAMQCMYRNQIMSSCNLLKKNSLKNLTFSPSLGYLLPMRPLNFFKIIITLVPERFLAHSPGVRCELDLLAFNRCLG